MSNGTVFDASAVLAVLQRERGHEVAAASLEGASISAVNYGEVLKKSAERGGSIAHVRAILAQQRLRIVPFDGTHAVRAAEIWKDCKPYGLSFADRACVSLGMMLDATVMTTEQNMTKVKLPVTIELIRKRQSN